MAVKSLLGKYGWEGWSYKEDNRALDATGAGDHLKEFSAVRAVVTNTPGVGMDVLWLPRVGGKLDPLTLERFTNPAPWNLCHDYPLGKVPAHPTGLFGAYQNYFVRSLKGGEARFDPTDEGGEASSAPHNFSEILKPCRYESTACNNAIDLPIVSGGSQLFDDRGVAGSYGQPAADFAG